jgi:UDP-MurNAc hydroxylase
MALSFSILGHACMLVESGGRRLLVDPWLIGSCYWRSWWHFPKPVELTPELFNVDAIYLTHGHFDHAHSPSLRKFDRSTPIVLARFATDRMRAGIEYLGFKNIIELPHGTPHKVGEGLTLYSYQHGFDDSAVVLEADGKKFLNLNDSHVTGLALRQILRRHGQIDFLLRSHAPAQGYPACYDAADPKELTFHHRGEYIDRFVNSIRIVRPRFAIPFASNVCHLHPETIDFNKGHITPRDVDDACRQVFGDESPVVVMMPGDSWTSTEGFHLTNAEAYREPGIAITKLVEQVTPKLDQSRVDEATVRPDFEKFRNYMRGFMRALPPAIRVVFRPVIVFEQPLAAKRYWVVDFNQWSVYESGELPKDTRSIIRIHPAVLMDAVEKSILFFVHISKRMRIHVPAGGMKEDFKFWGLIQLYETGYLPLHGLLTPRALAVFWRRRLEVLETMRSLLRPRRFEERAVPKVY